MTKPFFLSTMILFLFLGTAILSSANAQTDELQKLSKTIMHHDSIFWNAYNNCDVETMLSYMSDDFEFYHDKGGLTSTKKVFKGLLENGLCDPSNPRTRREVIPGSTKVYPLNNYGAILMGEHLFFVKEDGKKEQLTEKAKFTHVWHFGEGQWRMTRVLSYDHQPTRDELDGGK